MYTFALRGPIALAALAALNVNLILGVVVTTARPRALLIGAAPLILVALGALIASNRAVLVFAAFVLSLSSPLPLTGPLPLSAGIEVYASDLILLLAVGSWVAGWLLHPKESRPSSLHTRVLGWPLVLFGLVLVAAILQGHVRYGTSLISVSLRLVLYAGIAAAMTDLKPRDVYRWVVVIFYGGTLWHVLVALYSLATGTSATDKVVLSTGGARLLAGSTAMLMAGALVLALLNLEVDRRAGRTALHAAMATLATFALIYTFQRTTFALVPLLVPLSLLVFRRIGPRAAALLPLSVPFLVAAALLIPRLDANLFPTLADRLTARPSTDTSANWRAKATEAVWHQIREKPVTGVGFGRPASFTLNDQRLTIAQDPHNQFLYLWAGGGLLLLGSFVLLLFVYLLESWRRFRNGTREDRRLIFWAVSLWFVFLVNSSTGIILTSPPLLLVFWVLMVLPMVVRPGGRGAASLA
jgi:O-antigen ligase